MRGSARKRYWNQSDGIGSLSISIWTCLRRRILSRIRIRLGRWQRWQRRRRLHRETRGFPSVSFVPTDGFRHQNFCMKAWAILSRIKRTSTYNGLDWCSMVHVGCSAPKFVEIQAIYCNDNSRIFQKLFSNIEVSIRTIRYRKAFTPTSGLHSDYDFDDGGDDKVAP